MRIRISQWLKLCIEFNTNKRIEAEKNKGKVGKPLYKLMNNAIYGKTMGNLKNRIDVKLVNNEKHYLKRTSKPICMSHKIFENNLVVIRKSKLALKLGKPVSIGMCILDLSKVCTNSIMIISKIDMTTNQNYYSQTLIV